MFEFGKNIGFIISKYQIYHSEDECFPPFRINPEEVTFDSSMQYSKRCRKILGHSIMRIRVQLLKETTLKGVTYLDASDPPFFMSCYFILKIVLQISTPLSTIFIQVSY